MKKFLDLNTLLIVVGIVALGYIGYHKFYLPKNQNEEKSKEEIIQSDRVPKIVKIDKSLIGERGEDVFSLTENSAPLAENDTEMIDNNTNIINDQTEKDLQESKNVSPPTQESTPEDKAILPKINIEEITDKKDKHDSKNPILPPIEEERAPQDPSIPEDKLIPEETPEKEEPEEPGTPGFYENSTYNYSISYPIHWPIKIRQEENISIGTIPPKDGQGAITIEVTTENMEGEIEKAKLEAQKYPSLITINETPIIIDGVSGNKMTLYNSTINLTEVYIYLEKNGYYYVIKYSEESPSFVSEVEQSLTTFTF